RGTKCRAETVKPSPSPEGETLNSAVWSDVKLRPGEQRTCTFVLTWHFPSVVHGGDIAGWTTRGYMYENRYADAGAVARDVAKRMPELLRGTQLYHAALYRSNLPVWLLDRISSQVAVLRSPTVFWGADGYLGGWEGCSPAKGCCAGNCSHVWHYAQAHARLWPEIGRIMREQELRWMKEDGAVPHRQPDAPPAFDGQCGTILGSYREHLLSADRAWLQKHWPRVKTALDYLIRRWDADEDGILTGPQWNTLDENLGGSSSWLGSLYIAALMAGERMAGLMDEPEVAGRYGRIRKAAATKQDATLFNGRYYIQIPDETPYRDYGSGCHIDQVLGEWWSRLLDMDRVYPEEHVLSAMRALFESNLRYDFVGVHQVPRKFVHDDDAGLQMITWPQGGRPDPDHQMLYADEVMTGFEYAAASTMIYAGMLTEGLTVARAIYDRYDGRLREGLTASDFSSWGYSGNPFGDDECGKFYARAMSSWSLLQACQGLVYDGPAGLIGFRPRWKPGDHASFFTGAEGWGLFTQIRAASAQRPVQRERIEVRYGRLQIRTLLFEIPAAMRVAKVEVAIGGKPVACSG
ncbi:MAG: glucosylceramidase, partial [Armatimonadetes bacterium]|nr:glucosylceramidase [Armatimonadota bacterium]